MPLDWSILRTNAPVDIAGNFAQGYKIGQAVVDNYHQRNALAALANNPGDPSALSTLYAVNPTLGAHFDQRNAQRLKVQQDQQDRERRTSLGARYNEDPGAARQEAIAAGDYDLAEHFGKLDETSQKQAATFWQAAAPIAYRLKQMKDPAERAAYWQQNKGILASQAGNSALLEHFDPTNDAQLDGAISTAQKMSELIDQNKVVWHQQGEQPSFATDAMGRPVGSQNPYATGGAVPAPLTPQAEAVGTVLSSGGLPAPVVAGFLGNFHVEGGYGGAAGDGGRSKGIAQWNGERATNFARIVGKPVDQASPDEQAKFVLWEMQNPEAAGMTVAQRDAIMAAKSAPEAASLIDQFYERSSGEHRGRRVAAAERIGAPVRLASKAEFDRLPSGTEFIAPDGSHRRKP